MDITKVNYNDQAVWDMICTGNVKGNFQIESSLSKAWCKKIKPRNISELSDLIGLVRPGVLKFYFDGKSMAQHYADRKAGLDKADPIHESLREILAPTQQIILFQEQLIQIATKIAGFDDAKNRRLIKGVGKKDAELLFSLEKEFIDGCSVVKIVDENAAKLIFDNIKRSARYLFNKCWASNTLLEKENGSFIEIKDVKIGEYIKCPKLQHSDNEYVKVINKYDNGPKELVEITLESGKKVSSTIDHKFLCSDGQQYELWQIIENNMKIICDGE